RALARLTLPSTSAAAMTTRPISPARRRGGLTSSATPCRPLRTTEAAMRAWKLSERQLWALEALLLMGMAAASVWVAHADEWHPAALVALLIFVAFGGEWFTVEALTGVVSASLAVMALAMGLL